MSADMALRDLLAPANFSPDRLYRYTLARDLDPLGLELRGICAWCGLNPSIADERILDPTCRRETDYTRGFGFRHYLKVNAFGWRDTDPAGMLGAASPVGPENDRWILAAAEAADVFVLCWGAHGSHCGRDAELLRLLAPYAHKLRCLAVTKGGQPGHPLYLKKNLPLIEYRRAA